MVTGGSPELCVDENQGLVTVHGPAAYLNALNRRRGSTRLPGGTRISSGAPGPSGRVDAGGPSGLLLALTSDLHEESTRHDGRTPPYGPLRAAHDSRIGSDARDVTQKVVTHNPRVAPQ